MSYLAVSIDLPAQDRGPENWTAAIDHARAFPEESDVVEQWNFNRYNGTLTVRCEIGDSDSEAITAIADRMLDQGIINDYETSEWSEPEVVETAHHLAAECAMRFRDRADADQELEEAMSTNTFVSLIEENDTHQFVAFFSSLIHTFLNELGFTPSSIWDNERLSLIAMSHVEEIAAYCITDEMVAAVCEINSEHRPSFVERFVHLFFNCIGWQTIGLQTQEGQTTTVEIERNVKQDLLFAGLWNQIGDSFDPS